MRALTDLFANPPKEHPFYIGGGVLPKMGVLIFGGETGIGKTMLMLNMARDLSTPNPTLWGIPGLEIPERANVLYVDQETGEHGLYLRASKMWAGEEPGPVFIQSDHSPLKIDTHLGRKKLEDLIEESRAQVVMLDPASNFIDGSENSNDDVKKLFHALYDIRSRQIGVSFVLAHHFGKPPRGADDRNVFDPHERYNFRGAAKWVDSPDTVVTVVRVDHGLEKEELWRLNLSFEKIRHFGEPMDITRLSVKPNLHIKWAVKKVGTGVFKTKKGDLVG